MIFSLCVLLYWHCNVYVISYFVTYVVVISQGLRTCTFVTLLNIPYLGVFYSINIMDFLRSKENIPYCSHLFNLSLPSYFHHILLDFLNSSGLHKVFSRCMSFYPRSFTTEAACTWKVHRWP
jgi:hypothetical protein